ncbi:MAG TPA: M56 family metallopeptidase [Frateuria sp.]|uniref:M56 family metallopeptidase n=1 Tax=Frateuria sp. TaxID=2211372 RepID=UPI002D8070E2|nr:M56 family metallopeptidase [Frateuria sp.]HET6805289.1 M56 family metallopeptidase [Frateuria sp.]
MDAALAAARLIGWALVHSLWQGLLLGLVYGTCRSVVSRGEARYRLGLATMGSLVLMQAVTLAMLWRQVAPSAAGDTLAPLVATPGTGGSLAGPALAVLSQARGFDAALPWITLAWSSGVLLLASRAGLQWLDLRRLVQSAQASPQWQQRLDRLAAAFGLAGRVKVLCSDAVSSPVLIGMLRPVILLPVAVVCRMPVVQLELVLAHELAHVRRLDPLINLLQVVIETLYFHHPVVRWISRDVRNEREVCSDAMVVSARPGSRREYIEALATLGELREHGPTVLASNGGLLLGRVRLIAAAEGVDAGHGSPARLAAMGLGLLLVAAVASHEWNLVIPGIWQPDPSRPTWLAIDHPTLPPTWQLPDLAPRRTAPAYPRPATRPDPIPDIPLQAEVNRRDLLDASAVDAPLAILRPAGRVLPPALAERVDAVFPAATTAPTPVRMQPPVYPRQALEAGIEGAVVIEFDLGRHGRVRDMRVIRSEPEGVFDQAALTALSGWRYVPPAVPTTARFHQTISFVLHDAATRTVEPRAPGTRVPCTIPTGSHVCRPPIGA